VTVADVVDRLTLLGLDRPDAEILMHLLTRGTQPAGDVAKNLKLHRTEAYRRLRMLVDLGMATEYAGRPVRFGAVPAARIFENLRGAYARKIDLVGQVETELVGTLEAMAQPLPEEAAVGQVHLIQGRTNVLEAFGRMVAQTRTSIDAFSTHEAGLNLGALSGVLQQALSRGGDPIRMRALLRETPQTRSRVADLPKLPNLQFRLTDLSTPMGFTVRDGREVLASVNIDPATRLSSDLDVSLLTDAPPMVSAHALLFEFLWMRSPSLE
jgi:DNA-binding Lrp family transcriptional regulator